MKKRISTKQLTTTALLLALCIIFQSLKSMSVYLTGSAVNCILVIATLYCGIWSATPIVNMIPLMMPVIMLGNELLVLSVGLLKKKSLELGMLTGCITKAAFLWATVWFVVLPIFGTKLPEKLVTTVKATFSVTQFLTACIGRVIAWAIYKKGFIKHENTGNF